MKILIVEDQFIEAYDLQLILEKAGYQVTGIAHSVKQAQEMIRREKPDLVCLDIYLDENETGIDLAKKLKEEHIGFIYISANSGKSILDEVKKTQPYGFIVKPFREQDILTTIEIAEYRHRHTSESLLQSISILQQNIDAISYNHTNWNQALLQLGRTVQSYIPFDYMEAESSGISPKQNYSTVGLFRKNFEDYTMITADRFSQITILSVDELTKLKEESPRIITPGIYQNKEFITLCNKSALKRLVAQSFGIKSFIVLPVQLQDDQVYTFTFYSKQTESYTEEHINLLVSLENIITKFVKTFYKPLPTGKSKTAEKFIPVMLPAAKPILEGMIGSSKSMLTVFDHLKKVAPSDTSVLILGESGTGKEKIAQSIHRLSNRADKPFVVVNCGAIPDNLAESLLFGHEKGAFTGAIERNIGKFELADKGTIFLDEIGEMPMSLQVKLLRVLQENEIERIGGRNPIKIDARIIAATNKNLEEEVASGRFRMDLYYRLHIFPITIPALRERKEDIPALTNHFIELYCNKNHKEKLALSNNVLEQLSSYEWPGNIRQLEHLIQRSILLTDGKVIKEITLPKHSEPQQGYPPESSNSGNSVKTISENERDYICYILKKCKGKVYGAGGAAELLDLPASTLNSKIKKLGINTKAL